jgi:hypothetical protein
LSKNWHLGSYSVCKGELNKYWCEMWTVYPSIGSYSVCKGELNKYWCEMWTAYPSSTFYKTEKILAKEKSFIHWPVH